MLSEAIGISGGVFSGKPEGVIRVWLLGTYWLIGLRGTRVGNDELGAFLAAIRHRPGQARMGVSNGTCAPAIFVRGTLEI